MTLIPLAITTLCYLWVAFGFWQQGNGPLACAFVGYALSNCAFLYIALNPK